MSDLFEWAQAIYGAAKSRSTDPPASHLAEHAIQIRMGSQCYYLLVEFNWEENLTDEEAASRAAPNVSLDSEYATRCSQLRNGGYIRWVLDLNGEILMRLSKTSGMVRGVSEITDEGRQVLAQIDKLVIH